ncbi:5483_t:CDS:2 [Ambispora gerdemannii]|uniref:5483_t:CDS:1 n=1 Tax=Ambispora gerdemannii TaxID=144530 RepID=A0A9N9ACJ6_9GLOM|nr:5483_t:CDS:2 [Ambispora gerdemannii]
MVSQFPNFLQQIFIPPSDLVQYLENTIKKTATDDGGGVSETTGNKSLLGFCYEYGIGTTPKLNSAFNLYKEVALHNDKYAQNFVNMAGKFAVGLCLGRGIGTQRNEAESRIWYRIAAEGGEASGANSLARCYSKGYGGKVDLYKAAYWYRKSAQLENSDGQFTLGAMCWSGRGVSRDLHEGFKYLRRAYKNGNETTIRFLLWRGLHFSKFTFIENFN